MRIHCLQHVPFEGPALIGTWARQRGHALAASGLYRGDKLPALDDFDLLVVMGGPMSVNDERELPWIANEKRFIERTLAGGKKVLGVCLGAQFLANVLGALVYRAREKEIGWFPVRVRPEARALPPTADLPESFVAFHWHGETFNLPAGATHLAETDACPHQAFAHGSQALALQFHLEVTPEGVRDLARHCAADLTAGRYVQSAEEMCGPRAQFPAAEALLFKLLDRI